VLSLTGTASLADYEQAVTAITYANTSENPSNQDRILAENVFDGDVQSNTITITVSIIPVNDPPVVSMESSALLYAESSGAVAIDDQITVDDLDNDNLVSATIEISNNYTATEDRLDFADLNGISGTFDNQSGVLNLSGQATVAEYQEALRQVTYTNINEQAFTGTRLIEVIVNDGLDNSSMVMREITIEEVIDPVVIYQLVTPDGDSMNDTWTIDGIEQYPNNIVQIYNRYNNLVYQQTSYENSLAPWSGQANQGITSGDLTDGTYFYTVDLGDGSNIFEGFLVLKRK